jgi:hypothetical protein
VSYAKILIATFGILALLCLPLLAAYLRLTHDPDAPWRGTRPRARGTRARRPVPLILIAGRRARDMAAWVTSWFWWVDAWHPWQAARERIALRARGITITPTVPAAEDDTHSRKSLAASAGQSPGLPGATAPRGAQPPPPQDTTEPTRKATGAELRDARLDYAPSAPFADCLSDDTIARGMKAVRP